MFFKDFFLWESLSLNLKQWVNCELKKNKSSPMIKVYRTKNLKNQLDDIKNKIIYLQYQKKNGKFTWLIHKFIYSIKRQKTAIPSVQSNESLHNLPTGCW